MKARRFSHPELKVRAIATRRANKQLLRVPWRRFHQAYEEYLRWEALALWVRIIVGTAGSAPSLLAETLKDSCPDFIGKGALLNEPKLLGFHFHEWIHDHIFDDARREGWLDALIFYGVRDLRSQSTWEYWEKCEQEWHHKRPASYPPFDEWLCLARNYNLQQQRSAANFADIVERYVEWKAFDCWLEPLRKGRIALPRRVVTELGRRCPGFLQARTADFTRGGGKQVATRRHFITWIENHFFSKAKAEGRFDIILKQACSHPLHVRVTQYSKRWNKSWPLNPTGIYPSFVQWYRAAENYTENQVNGPSYPTRKRLFFD